MWCAPGRSAQTLQAFFGLLGERKHTIRAVSIDMAGGYQQAIRENLPHAEICFDPFHVVRLAQRAVDQVRRDEWNAHTQLARLHGTRNRPMRETPSRQTRPNAHTRGAHRVEGVAQRFAQLVA